MPILHRSLALTYAAVCLVAGSEISEAAVITVTTTDDGFNNVGASGTFYWALTNCNAGDTIAFNIPGPGPHYLLSPQGGFPLVYKKNNLVIDGYTQPGASPNTHAITQPNNADIKIVIDARNGNSRNMAYNTYDGTIYTSDPPIDNTAMAFENAGYGSNERALLGIYRSTNVNVRGIAFLGTFLDPNGDQKGICFAHDYGLNTAVLDRLAYTEGSDAYGHVNGCWFGIDPGNPTIAGMSPFLIAIAHYRHRDSGGGRPDLPNVGLTVGVRPGSANPRAEFNVFAGFGYCMDGECIRTRVSGNFFGVLPDGVTAYNMPEMDPNNFQGGAFEFGRYNDTEPIIIGTDGDGVNDADEGNLFGPLAGQKHHLDFYSTGRKSYIIAGNRFGIAVDGTRWTNNYCELGTFQLNQGTQVRFGSDFNSVSDDLEGNVVYNNNVFSLAFTNTPPPDALSFIQDGLHSTSVQTDAWVSVRGNVMVNNFPTFNPDDTSGSASQYTNWWLNYITDGSQTVPVLSPNSTTSRLIGTCGYPTNGYTNLVIDLYVPDPEAQTNGTVFGYDFFGGINGWGFVQGRTHLGSFLDNGPYDSDRAVGSFALDITGLAIAHGTKVTATVTYSAFALPAITGISRSGTNTVLTWTGDNGGPYAVPGSGAPSSGFGLQRAANLNGPWTTVAFARTNGITVGDGAGTSFYRIGAPLSGMTTLCAKPITLP